MKKTESIINVCNTIEELIERNEHALSSDFKEDISYYMELIKNICSKNNKK